MAQKRINDLQLRSDFDETCNFPTDDLVQTWRVTGQQILDFVNDNLDNPEIVAYFAANSPILDKMVNASAAIKMSKTNFAVAYLKDVKTAGTAGGGFTSGSFVTRTLNTEEDPDNIVTLSSNQFTLQAGTYEIDASAPSYLVGQNVTKIRNITDSTDAIIGTSEYQVAGGSGAQVRSFVKGIVTIASAKAFEIQHRCLNTVATNGLGVTSGLGVSEVYTVVKITRIK